MEVGVALPTMATGYSRDTTLGWAAGIDGGPFSSISCGERMSFHNQEMWVTCAAAAALTERVRVFVNLAVLPAHPVGLVAKQTATLDVLSGGRVTLGVGVGGRAHDYRVLEADQSDRHRRLDDQVGELRSLWAGTPPFDGADPVGPAPVQGERIPILAGAMGPRSMARAARWADGVSGFSLTADGAEMAAANEQAHRAWEAAERDTRPRCVSGVFCVLGGDDPGSVLAGFTFDYLRVFGEGLARQLAAAAPVYDADALCATLDAAARAGCDEFVLVPGTTDLGCLDALTRVVAGWNGPA